MKLRRRILWITVTVLAVVFAAGFFWTQREPQFRGRPVSEWLDAYAATETRPGAWVDRTWGPRTLRDSQTGRPLKDPDLEALASIGAAAVPALTRHVRTGFLDSDRYLKVRSRLPASVAPLFPSPWDRTTRRFYAVEILLSLGPQAKTALPALVELLNVTSPSSFGPMPMGALVGGMTPGRPFVPVLRVRDRDRLVEAVCRICGDSRQLEPWLLELGRRGHFRSLVELAAAGGWQGAETAAFLAAAQDDPDAGVRCAAMRLLESAPNLIPPVLTRVVKALKDPEGEVRWQAARTIEASGARGPEVTLALQEAAGDSSAMVQTVARRTLEKLAQAAAGSEAVP